MDPRKMAGLEIGAGLKLSKGPQAVACVEAQWPSCGVMCNHVRASQKKFLCSTVSLKVFSFRCFLPCATSSRLLGRKFNCLPLECSYG